MTGAGVEVEGVEGEKRVPAERASEPLRVGWLLLVPLVGLLFVVVPFVVRRALIEGFEFEGPSMEPTLCNSERFVVDKEAYGIFLPFADEPILSERMPRLGDIVVIHSPLDGVDIVKRVVGLPGDRIEIGATSVVRNGVTLPHGEVACPPHMRPGPPTTKCFREQLDDHTYSVIYSRAGDAEPTVVPADHVYVLGDNRNMSNDSRNPAMGPIHRSRLKGRATRIYWSRHPGRTFLLLE